MSSPSASALALDEAGTRHDQGIDMGCDFLACYDLGRRAQILDPSVGAGTDEDAIDFEIGDLLAAGKAHVIERAPNGGALLFE